MEYKLCGRITADEAEKLDKELSDVMPDTIDASDLTYISSAGLRALLSLSRKKEEKIRVENVSPDVYGIFESTGFTKLFDISKALREVSAKGLKLLGKGYCASVYRLDSERIIKVYDAPRHAHDLGVVEKEYEISRKVFLLGLPSTISYEVVLCDGYYAGIYELVEGDTLGNTLYEKPDLMEEYTRKMAGIGRMMNSIAIDDADLGDATFILTRRRERIIPYLTEEELNNVDALIAAIPDKGMLVHGDFHIENVMVQKGELVLIDVGGMSHGHPILDLLCMYMKATEPAYLETKLDFDTCKKMWEIYIDEYFKGRLTDTLRRDLEEILSLFADLFMLPAYCTQATIDSNKAAEAKEKIRQRLDRIMACTPERLTKLLEAVDALYDQA